MENTLPLTGTITFTKPLEMRWQPKEDITTYELAKCLPYLLRQYNTMPYEINKSEKHFRHFLIIDHNDKPLSNKESYLVPYHTVCISSKNGGTGVQASGCSIANTMVRQY